MELYTVGIRAFWHEHSMRAHEVQKCGEPRLCPGEPVAASQAQRRPPAYQDTVVNKLPVRSMTIPRTCWSQVTASDDPFLLSRRESRV